MVQNLLILNLVDVVCWNARCGLPRGSFLLQLDSQCLTQTVANLIMQLSMVDHDKKIALTYRLLWTHRFDVLAVIKTVEELLDGQSTHFC